MLNRKMDKMYVFFNIIFFFSKKMKPFIKYIEMFVQLHLTSDCDDCSLLKRWQSDTIVRHTSSFQKAASDFDICTECSVNKFSVSSALFIR